MENLEVKEITYLEYLDRMGVDGELKCSLYKALLANLTGDSLVETLTIADAFRIDKWVSSGNMPANFDMELREQLYNELGIGLPVSFEEEAFDWKSLFKPVK